MLTKPSVAILGSNHLAHQPSTIALLCTSLWLALRRNFEAPYRFLEFAAHRMQAERKHRWLSILIWSIILTLTLVILTAALLLPPNVNDKILQIYQKSFMAAELGSLPAIPESSSEDDESERRHVRARRQPVQPPPPGWVPNGVHAPPSAEPAQPVGGPSMGTPMCQRRQRRQRHRRCHTERDHHQVLCIAERLDSAWIRRYLSDQDPTTVKYRAGARGK